MIKLCQHYDEDPRQGCGGCLYQHMVKSDYYALKRKRLQDALDKNNLGDVDLDDVVEVAPGTRWRGRFHVIRTKDSIQIGFQKSQSHHIIDMQECHILMPSLFNLLNPLRDLMTNILAIRQRCEVQLTVLDAQIDLLVFINQPFALKARRAFSQFAEQYKISRIAQCVKNQIPEIIVLRGPVYKMINGFPVPLPVGGFLQASEEGEKTLVSLVQQCILQAKPKKIADLFCGIGTFSFPLAEEKFIKTIIGYDSFSPAIQAYNTAANTNNLGRLTAKTRDLFELPLITKELNQFDAVIIDPPRKGAIQQMRYLAKSSVPLVISVSCHPETFARDSRILLDGGYQVQRIIPIDQFVWSNHIETVGIFRKQKSAARKRRL